MKKQNKHVIAIVQDGSIAQELELVPGDILLTVNGQPVEDIFDYRYVMIIVPVPITAFSVLLTRCRLE